MTRRTALQHAFTDTTPDKLDDGVVYISIRYATVIHLCCCGCRSEVVTPLRPDAWTLVFDGTSVSLWPSIGNWSFPCQSHYWIERSRIRWARRWSQEEIAARQHRAATSAPEHAALENGHRSGAPGRLDGVSCISCTKGSDSPETGPTGPSRTRAPAASHPEWALVDAARAQLPRHD